MTAARNELLILPKFFIYRLLGSSSFYERSRAPQSLDYLLSVNPDSEIWIFKTEFLMALLCALEPRRSLSFVFWVRAPALEGRRCWEHVWLYQEYSFLVHYSPPLFFFTTVHHLERIRNNFTVNFNSI